MQDSNNNIKVGASTIETIIGAGLTAGCGFVDNEIIGFLMSVGGIGAVIHGGYDLATHVKCKSMEAGYSSMVRYAIDNILPNKTRN